MPVKTFVVSKKVNKIAKKLPIRLHKKINTVFDILKNDPLAGDKLRGELADFRKYRIGDYRVVYQFDSKTETLTIIKIEHRQGVYR